MPYDYQRQILAGYMACNIDETGDPKYYGFQNPTGRWYIMSMTATGVMLYRNGASGYAAAWTGRASGAAYQLPDAIAWT